MKRKALLFILATITATALLFSGCGNKETETPPVAEETIEETEAEEIEPVEEVEATEPEENTTGQLSGAGEVDLDELDEFYNNDEVYEEFLNEQQQQNGNTTDGNTSGGNNNETTEKPEGWHTGDDLDAYLDSIGGTDITYIDDHFYPGDDYDLGW